MKRTTILTLALALAASAATAAERTARIEVADLTCPSCGAIAMNLMRGVDSAEVLDAEMTGETVGLFTLRFDDTLTSAADIAAAVTAGAGYPADVVDD